MIVVADSMFDVRRASGVDWDVLRSEGDVRDVVETYATFCPCERRSRMGSPFPASPEGKEVGGVASNVLAARFTCFSDKNVCHGDMMRASGVPGLRGRVCDAEKFDSKQYKSRAYSQTLFLSPEQRKAGFGWDDEAALRNRNVRDGYLENGKADELEVWEKKMRERKKNKNLYFSLIDSRFCPNCDRELLGRDSTLPWLCSECAV